jgi:hypothetical protein
MSGKSLRDILRNAVLGAKPNFKTSVVEVDGQKYEIRQPTNKQRSVIMKSSRVENSKGEKEADDLMLTLNAIIALTYVPDTEEKVFEPTDYDMLSSLPAGGITDKLGNKAIQMLLNVGEDEVGKESTEASTDEVVSEG